MVGLGRLRMRIPCSRDSSGMRMLLCRMILIVARRESSGTSGTPCGRIIMWAEASSARVQKPAKVPNLRQSTLFTLCRQATVTTTTVVTMGMATVVIITAAMVMVPTMTTTTMTTIKASTMTTTAATTTVATTVMTQMATATVSATTTKTATNQH